MRGNGLFCSSLLRKPSVVAVLEAEGDQKRIPRAEMATHCAGRAAGASLLTHPSSCGAEICLLQTRCSFPDIELFVKVRDLKQSNCSVCVCVWGKLFAVFEIDLIALRRVKEQAELVLCLCCLVI